MIWQLTQTAPSTLNANENVTPKAHHPHWQFNFYSARFQRSLLQYIAFHCIEEVAAVHIRDLLFECFAHIWSSTPFNSHSCQKKALWTLALRSALLNGLKLHSFLITTTDSWLYLICLTVDNLILYLCLCWLTDICCCHSLHNKEVIRHFPGLHIGIHFIYNEYYSYDSRS